MTQQSELRLWLEANPAHLLAERNRLTGKESRGVLRDQRGCGSANTEPWSTKDPSTIYLCRLPSWCTGCPMFHPESMWPVNKSLRLSWGQGAGPALPVFLACINRGEFCKALSTSSEVKCGRGATKQNKKATSKWKKERENYLPWKIKKKKRRRKKISAPPPAPNTPHPKYHGLLGNLSMALLPVSMLKPRWEPILNPGMPGKAFTPKSSHHPL